MNLIKETLWEKMIKYVFILLLIMYQTPCFSQIKTDVMPSNIKECLTLLDTLIGQERQAEIIKQTENEFVAVEHFGLGLAIRNQWLHSENLPLLNYFEAKRIFHKDAMSSEILSSYYRYLKEKEQDSAKKRYFRSCSDLHKQKSDKSTYLYEEITEKEALSNSQAAYFIGYYRNDVLLRYEKIYNGDVLMYKEIEKPNK